MIFGIDVVGLLWLLHWRRDISCLYRVGDDFWIFFMKTFVGIMFFILGIKIFFWLISGIGLGGNGGFGILFLEVRDFILRCRGLIINWLMLGANFFLVELRLFI